MENGRYLGFRNTTTTNRANGEFSAREQFSSRTAAAWPNITNTALLLRFENNLTDVYSHTFTNSGVTFTTTPTLSTNGTYAGVFNGSSYCYSISSDFALTTNDFTVEFFMNLSSTSGNQYILDIGTNSFVVQYSNRLVFYSPGTGNGGVLYTGGPTLTAGNTYHVAICRAGGTIKAFCGGLLWGSQSSAESFTSTTCNLGRYGGGGLYYSGYMDDFKITKDQALYSSNFTPPTSL